MAEADAGTASGDGSITTKRVKIQVLDPDMEKKEVAWLGVSTEEASDVLSAQLGLNPGDGLVILFVQPESPAAKAGLQKNDVLTEFGDQLLVHPLQFRKLVRRQKDGDKINLTLYRNGKKQTVAATLTKTTERAGLNSGRELWAQVNDTGTSQTVRDQIQALRQSVAYSLPRQIVEVEVQRNVDEARKALREALAHNHAFASALGSEATNVEALAKSEAQAGGATVTVKRNARSVKTMVKTDETGTYVIIAAPRKRLTVHDRAGKLLFDGEIETTEQQQKVPANLLPKAQSMINEMGISRDPDEPASNTAEE